MWELEVTIYDFKMRFHIGTSRKQGTMTKTQAIVLAETIESRIFLIRGHKVMLSTHLAALYGVEPRALVQAVKRNHERFPADFMFQLNAKELANLKSQIVISFRSCELL